MKENEILNHVKAALRVTTDDPGIISEVVDLIERAKFDLKASGIKISTTNELGEEVYDETIVSAISLYCKSQFGFDNPEADRLYEAYRMFEKQLALSKEYKDEV